MTGSTYRIGVDVGDNSVGLAAIEVDESGIPLSILSALSFIHDGGLSPGTAKAPVSRKATAGTARRTRRLHRRRRARLEKLDEVLVGLGWPVPDSEQPQSYDAWIARDKLASGRIEDEAERLRLLALAVRHLARHRGWRNPWLSVDQLQGLPVPSENFTAMRKAAAGRLGVEEDSLRTVGQLARGALRPSSPIRPRTWERDGKRALALDIQPVLMHRVPQEDQLAELRLILDIQGIPESTSDDICRAVFIQVKPHVPSGRVGRDSLPGMEDQPRASRATLEFQQFRVWSTVANLRIADGETRRLTAEEQGLLVTRLLDWREPEPPNWTEVAEMLDIHPRKLRGKPSVDEFGSTGVPTDRTSAKVEGKFGKSTPIGRWWREASSVARAELIDYISDPTDADHSEELSQVLAGLDEAERDKLESLQLESGRCPYSRASLSRLVDRMKADQCDLHTARKLEFGVGDDWRPEPETFSNPIDHPTVAIISKTVHRFLLYCTEKWGLPEQVVVEHVRSSFLGPSGRAEYLHELKSNTRRRDAAKLELKTQGIERPTNSDIRRRECIQRQNSQCLYCGAAIRMSNSELDHIVPRKGGGSNRSDNLVAVCHECNSAKSNLPFAVFAARSGRAGVSLDEATARVKEWNRDNLTARQLAQLKRRVIQRLKLESDAELDDRGLESTAYAARQMRERITDFMRERTPAGAEPPGVLVFPGAVTASARRAGGVDAMLRIRGKGTKDRFDRRHHAIDAAVQSTITPFVAEVLAERSRMRASHLLTGDEPGWKEFEGNDAAHQLEYRRWRERARSLAVLLKQRVEEDRVPVVRPLRLSARVGRLHTDKPDKLVAKDITETWTRPELGRVADPAQFDALMAQFGAEGSLPEDPYRRSIAGGTTVQLFKKACAQIAIRGGSCEIGDTIHHSRIYAWPTKTGFRYGQIRVYGGEFASLGMLAPGVDLFAYPLPAHSQSMRTADATTRTKVQSGEARMIGWITVNDEMELDPAEFVGGNSQLARALAEMPERRWVVTGYYQPSKVAVAPALLASEGLPDIEPGTPDPIPEMRAVVQGNRTPVAVNVLLSAPGTKVIRRSASGIPRWRDDGLPFSWDVRRATERAFEH